MVELYLTVLNDNSAVPELIEIIKEGPRLFLLIALLPLLASYPETQNIEGIYTL